MKKLSDRYDYQKSACKHFFVDKLPDIGYDEIQGDDGPASVKTLKGTKYDITGLKGHQVVALLSKKVVNDQSFGHNKTYYLYIQGDSNDELELFQIKANPTQDQPGNGVVSLRPRAKKKLDGAKKYDELNGALEAYYNVYHGRQLLRSDTKEFSRHIFQLFQNNAKIAKFPEATSEAYMILLFEIARRLVRSVNPTDMKKKLDVLPIGSAIAGFLQLLYDKQCSFEEVFLPGGKLHCFSKGPEDREEAIRNINAELFLNNSKITLNYKFYLQELLKWYN